MLCSVLKWWTDIKPWFWVLRKLGKIILLWGEPTGSSKVGRIPMFASLCEETGEEPAPAETALMLLSKAQTTSRAPNQDEWFYKQKPFTEISCQHTQPVQQLIIPKSPLLSILADRNMVGYQLLSPFITVQSWVYRLFILASWLSEFMKQESSLMNRLLLSSFVRGCFFFLEKNSNM